MSVLVILIQYLLSICPMHLIMYIHSAQKDGPRCLHICMGWTKIDRGRMRVTKCEDAVPPPLSLNPQFSSPFPIYACSIMSLAACVALCVLHLAYLLQFCAKRLKNGDLVAPYFDISGSARTQDSQPPLLYLQISFMSLDPFHQRRHLWVFHLLPPFLICTTCPLLHPNEARTTERPNYLPDNYNFRIIRGFALSVGRAKRDVWCAYCVQRDHP